MKFINKLKDLNKSHIAFLVKKNFPELALNSVKDHRTRFALACKAFRIEDALETAENINDNKCWEQFAEVAMLVGNATGAEIAYKRMKRPYKLAILYLVTGQGDKMIEARKMAKEIHDKSTEFIISLLMKDFETCVKVMLESGHPGATNLAYACAANHGLPDLAAQIKNQLTPEQQQKLPEVNIKQTSWMKSCIPSFKKNSGDVNWPLLKVEYNYDEVIEDIAEEEPIEEPHEEPEELLEDFEPDEQSDDGASRSNLDTSEFEIKTREKMSSWSESEVAEFIASLPEIKDQAPRFLENEVDGKALLLLIDRDLNVNFLTSVLQFKVGPALKIVSALTKYKSN